MMSYPYSSKEVDKIEEEFSKLDLELEQVEIVKQSISIDIIENDIDLDMDLEDVKIVKKPTKVEFLEN